MKVPFFRIKDKQKLERVASESSLSDRRASSSSTLSQKSQSSPAVHGMTRGQLGEMQDFLGRITEFQGEARRLFPEHMALDQILSELRDECQRRVDYMGRVSAPAWQGPASSSTVAPAAAKPPRRGSTFAPFAGLRARSKSNARESSSDSSSSDSSGGYGQRGPDRRTLLLPSASPSPPSSPTQARPQAATVGSRRRQTAPQSMLVPSLAADRPTSHAGARASLALPASEAPRLPRVRTASVDAFSRPQSFFEGSNSGGGGNGDPSVGVRGSQATLARAGGKTQRQHMAVPAKSSGDYVVTVVLGGRKMEAAVSSSLQTSLVTTQLASAMGLPVTQVPAHSRRVWNSSGKSWPIVGEVANLPFACGKMTFTHSFKVVHGAAAANDMPREIVLANDFCVGNKGHIKDNRLHLEKLALPISVPVRLVS